jgi:hypothetical protein
MPGRSLFWSESRSRSLSRSTRKSPAGVSGRVKPWLEDVDRQGRNLHSFAADLAEEALSHGLTGILVDAPPAQGLRTLAEEQAAGIRPYFVHIRHDAILGWKTEATSSGIRLKQLRLLESVEEDDGEFGTKMVEQVRVLEPGKWTTYRKIAPDGGKAVWTEYQTGTTKVPEIPFVPIYGRRADFMIGTPPMIELGHANVEHWQSKSDQQNILHVARVPILFGKELGAKTALAVGANALIKATSKDADLKYVEHSGKAIEAGRTSILDLEDRMRQIGAELLVLKPGNRTVVETLADNEQGKCDLQRMMESMEDGLDTAIDFMAQFAGERSEAHVTIFKDFGVANLAEASAQLLAEMNGDGTLSDATLLNEMKRRGIISPDVDVDKEITAARADAKDRQPQRKENVNL